MWGKHTSGVRSAVSKKTDKSEVFWCCKNSTSYLALDKFCQIVFFSKVRNLVYEKFLDFKCWLKKEKKKVSKHATGQIKPTPYQLPV